MLRLPSWVKVKLPGHGVYRETRQVLKKLQLNTVCEQANCPNLGECWGCGTATFLILGDICTRGCRFCNVKTGKPIQMPSIDEPARVAQAIEEMDLRYAVITSVDRDDLADNGAEHFVNVVKAVLQKTPDVIVELLTPDFGGKKEAISKVACSGAHVLGHNIETVRRLTRIIRDVRCDYDMSLEVLREYRAHNPHAVIKSSLLLGVGETEEDIKTAMADLRAVDVDWITFGQYLQPSRKQMPVVEFILPEQFDHLAEMAKEMGFALVTSGPLVRSSYRAAEKQAQILIRKKSHMI